MQPSPVPKMWSLPNIYAAYSSRDYHKDDNEWVGNGGICGTQSLNTYTNPKNPFQIEST
jgi:hypothetical protein